MEGNILSHPPKETLVGRRDAVYDLAVVEDVELIREEAVETLTTNVLGTEFVLDLAAQHGRKVFLASTPQVYGKTLEDSGHVHTLKEDGTGIWV